MSVSSLMSIGARAMTANYAALQATGNNIANANTAGYSRQSVELATGVRPVHRRRLLRQGRRRRHRDARAQRLPDPRGGDDARRWPPPTRRAATQLQQLENVFPTGEAGIGYAAAAAVQRLRRRRQQAAGLARRARWCWPRIGDLAARFRTRRATSSTRSQAGVTPGPAGPRSRRSTR